MTDGVVTISEEDTHIYLKLTLNISTADKGGNDFIVVQIKKMYLEVLADQVR